jgi:hypothetical protein
MHKLGFFFAAGTGAANTQAHKKFSLKIAGHGLIAYNIVRSPWNCNQG